MSAQDNMKMTRQFYDAINLEQPERATELVAPDAVWEMVPFRESFRGPSGFAENIRQLQDTFSGMKVEVTNQLASDEAVVCELRVTGKQTGPLKTPDGEIPPTGNRVEMRVVDIFRIRNGKIAGLHAYFDTGAIIQQLQKAA